MADEFKHTRAFVTNYANQVEQEIETRLHNAGKVASGELYDSIGYEIKETPKGFTVTFKMADYGQYVDKGVNGIEKNWGSRYSYKEGNPTGGKSKFISALQRWCEIKGIDKGAAYPIRAHIFKMGIAPTNFFTIPTTRRVKQLEQGIKKNMALDIENALKQEVRKAK